MLGIKELGIGGVIIIGLVVIFFGKKLLLKTIKEWKNIKDEVTKTITEK